MTISQRIGSVAGTLTLIAGILCTTGCHNQPVHPNQINVFDGATYDSLTLAHGVLTSLRASIPQGYPRYRPAFNDSVKAYNDALTAYTFYRETQNEGGLAPSLSNLTAAIVLLETALQSELHVPPGQTAAVRTNALHIRQRAARANISVSDVLAELQIAAAIAQTIPAAAPYYPLARTIIDATTFALNAEEAEAGKPIDLLTIPALVPIV